MPLSHTALNIASGAVGSFKPFSRICQHVCGFHFYAHDMKRGVSSTGLPFVRNKIPAPSARVHARDMFSGKEAKTFDCRPQSCSMHASDQHCQIDLSLDCYMLPC